MTRQDGFPTIRVLHQMARTGGTLLAKCLASMRGVVLLSEIHPKGLSKFSPLTQARKWYPGLLDEGEIGRLFATDPSFREVIMYINQKAQARGERLLVRDWSHLDFTGVPHVPTPSYRLATAEALAPDSRLVHAACVRHPIDQWLSVSKLTNMSDRLQMEAFMQGCRHFAEAATDIGFVRYEDFTQNPDAILRVICEKLEIDFDPSYRERWADYHNVTGDDGRYSNSREIKQIAWGEVPPELLSRLANNRDYRMVCELLGYPFP